MLIDWIKLLWVAGMAIIIAGFLVYYLTELPQRKHTFAAHAIGERIVVLKLLCVAVILLGLSTTHSAGSLEQHAKEDRKEQAIAEAASWWSGIESAPGSDQVVEARQLLEASADKGNLDAEVALLFAEAESRAVSNARSDAILKRLVSIARENRNVDAAIALAEIASRGLIGKSGPKEKHADNMYEAAMALGSVQAEYLFAKHKLRWGRLTDWMKHLEQSAAKGHTRALHEVAIVLMDSDLEEVRKRGAEMLATSARRGYPPAQLELGRILAESPVAEQREQGAKLIESASRLMQGR